MISNLRQNKDVRVFVWTLISSLIALAMSFAISSPYAMLLIPALNALTKYINVTFFNDLGVK